jgi:hypothetical protein
MRGASVFGFYRDSRWVGRTAPKAAAEKFKSLLIVRRSATLVDRVVMSPRFFILYLCVSR